MSNFIHATSASNRLRSFIERIERIEADIAELNSDKSDVYKEARSEGYDVKILRKVVSKRKLDADDRDEQDAIFEMYWNAVHGLVHVHTHAREMIEEFDPETGEITESVADVTAPFSTPAESVADEISAPINEPGDDQSAVDAVPSFLRKQPKPLRPHCLNPGDECGGYGSKHCHSCEIAAREGEAA